MTFEKEPVEIRTRPRFGPRARLTLAAVGLLAAVTAVWLWSERTVDRTMQIEREDQLAHWREEADRARERLATEDTTDARMRLVETLLRAERTLAELEPGGLSARLPEITRLETELDRLLAAAKLELSRRRESELAGLVAAGDTAAAERALREAWELQREVNRSGPDLWRDREREARLEREFVTFVAEPLKQRVDDAVARAQAALSAEQWSEALALFRNARAGQERLNREFARTRFSDLTLLARLDAEIAVLDTDGLDAQVESAWAEARRLAAGGQEIAAAEAFARAVTAQRDLNARFSRSRFVSMERLEQIEAERQTLLATESRRAAAGLEQRARDHLRRRQIFQAEQALRAAAEQLAAVSARWPKARGADEALLLRLTFLQARAGELGAIQDRLFEGLRPLPGDTRHALLGAAVRQEEFQAVMSRNPSRTSDAGAPVDSVSFEEAQEFCTRLSWVLGRAVRLPSAEELRRAAAADEFKELDGARHEWVGDGANDGASLWRQATDGAVQRATPASRARDRGFRVVVEIDLTAPDGA